MAANQDTFSGDSGLVHCRIHPKEHVPIVQAFPLYDAATCYSSGGAAECPHRDQCLPRYMEFHFGSEKDSWIAPTSL